MDAEKVKPSARLNFFPKTLAKIKWRTRRASTPGRQQSGAHWRNLPPRERPTGTVAARRALRRLGAPGVKNAAAELIPLPPLLTHILFDAAQFTGKLQSFALERRPSFIHQHLDAL